MATNPSHDSMANAIRFLAVDAVEKAKSGHPGLPMGAADVATVLFRDVLKFDASDPALARPRPLRPVGRPRLDAALCASLFDRRRRRQGPDDRRPEAFPAARLEDAGPSGIRPRARRRDDDGPVGAGHRDLGRHGDRRADAGGAFSGDRRPSHLRARFRRRPDGGRQPGGDRHRRPSQALQAHRLLRRQRHLDRRQDVARRFRRSGHALRIGGLEREPDRRA